MATSTAKSGLSELKQRLLFLLLGILVYRIGSHIPVPGLNPQRLADLFNKQNGVLGLFNMFSGGNLQKFTIFALGVMPYISSSIIIQLFTSVVPQLEQLKKEGESGRRKISQYTRYGTLALAIFQGLGIAKWLASNGTVLDPGVYFYFVTTLTLATGTMFLVWLGEQMTERGVGNGISMIIITGIISGLPGAIIKVMSQVRQGQMQVITLFLLVAIVMVVTGFVVFVERGQRKIAVNYAKRQMTLGGGYNSQSSNLPLKINMAGVIPPIFASSIVMFPATIAQWFGQSKGMHWLSQVGFVLSMGQPLYYMFYTAAIVFFCYFYTALVFSPKEIAENLKRSGAFIPGIRPGENTASYIDLVITRLTLFGAIYITMVSLLPDLLMFKCHMPFYFGGTSLLIVVVVLMDFMSQVQAHLMSHQYDSIMKKTRLKGGSMMLR